MSLVLNIYDFLVQSDAKLRIASNEGFGEVVERWWEMCLGNVWVHTVDVLTLIRTEKAVFPYRLIKTRIRYRTFFRTKRGLLETAKRNQHCSPAI